MLANLKVYAAAREGKRRKRAEKEIMAKESGPWHYPARCRDLAQPGRTEVMTGDRDRTVEVEVVVGNNLLT